ncbi:MAG: YtxH domain-containing protein [Rikenellaceae bacterium]|nr:YtxH domain-containing protein [Rikenellaceae bacterium]
MKKGILCVLGGVVLGAAVALLYAPESGTKTRRRIKRFVEDEKDRLMDVYEDVQDRLEDEAGKLKKRFRKG